MHFTAVITILAGAATLGSAAPSGQDMKLKLGGATPGQPRPLPKAKVTWGDIKIIDHPPARRGDPTYCAPGTGYYQRCEKGNFDGCCTQDACSLGYCPGSSTANNPSSNPSSNPNPNSDPTQCAPGTGFFQFCSNGFRGCCTQDVCTGSSGTCPDNSIVNARDDSDDVQCSRGTYQKCPNGFQGCCENDACASASGACPDETLIKARSDPSVCAPGTGYYQRCASGFEGCCTQDACTIGYCPTTTY